MIDSLPFFDIIYQKKCNNKLVISLKNKNFQKKFNNQ